MGMTSLTASNTRSTRAFTASILYGNFTVKHADELDEFRKVFHAPSACQGNVLTCPPDFKEKWGRKSLQSHVEPKFEEPKFEEPKWLQVEETDQCRAGQPSDPCLQAKDRGSHPTTDDCAALGNIGCGGGDCICIACCPSCPSAHCR